MITEIPSSDDFKAAGIDFFNMAWDIITDLSRYLHESGLADDKEITEEYWLYCQRRLALTISLAQQGVEFLLKGRIAGISPFLLLAQESRAWPKESANKDIPFADFRTINSSDLVKIHNTICPIRLPADFSQHHKKLRKLRNTIMHTVKLSLTVTIKKAYLAILESHFYLVDDSTWLRNRFSYLEDGAESYIFVEYHCSTSQIYDEILVAQNYLTNREKKKYFNLSRSRRYICPHCWDSVSRKFDTIPLLAQLKPNKPQGTRISCILCETNSLVIRKKCTNFECKSNVLLREEKSLTCLLCGNDQAS